MLEWWFNAIDFMATDYCVLRSGSVDACKWHITLIFIVPFVAIPLGMLLRKLNKRK